MKITTFLKKSLLGLAVVPVVMYAGGSSVLAAQIPFVPGQPLPTTSTPAFNVFTNIPNGIGDESDFVRLRAGNGDPTDPGPNGSRNSLYTDTLNAACNAGDLFDVRTYVHNGADPTFNNNGTGTAVAHGVKVASTASLGVEDNTFKFTSTITSTNAGTVTDDGTLNCGRNVKLELVPTSVKAHSDKLGWVDVSKDVVNGKINIGSQVMNSGDVWGCWEQLVLVVYTVKVVDVPAPPAPIFSCDLLTNTGKIAENKFGFKVNVTAKNGATLKDVTYVFSDGTSSKDGLTTTHLFTDTNPLKHITATANFMVNGVEKSNTSAKCETDINVPKTPVVLAATTTLPDTGMGSLVGIFAGTSILGAFLYRMRVLRGNR